jgi:single-stranded-DNA-specific exonuclease
LADFPLYENLCQCSDLLEKFGGHKMAAGIQIAKDKLDLLRKKLHDLAGTELCNSLNIDCIPSSKIIHTNLTSKIEVFRPFGPLNEKPNFLLKDYEIINISQMGNKNNHLRLLLKKENLFLTVVAFNRGDLFYLLTENDIIDVVGTFEINEYNGKITNQFFVQDIKCKSIQIFDYRSKKFNFNNIKDLDVIYFDNDYGYQNAIKYHKALKTKKLVLVDLPDRIEDLVTLIKESQFENMYLLFRCDDLFSSEHLLNREKMGKLYQVLKKYKKVKINNERLQYDLQYLGFDKKLQNIAIHVFFDLNFVIIENDEIIIVDNPEKRNLNESKTFNQVNETIKLKEKLLLSSTKELKEFILKLSMEDKNEY